jgi:hypothetical protein
LLEPNSMYLIGYGTSTWCSLAAILIVSICMRLVHKKIVFLKMK